MKSYNGLVQVISGFVAMISLAACTTTQNPQAFKPNSEKIKAVDADAIYGEIDGNTADANPWASESSQYPSWVPPVSNPLPVEGESAFSSKSPAYEKGKKIQRASAKTTKTAKTPKSSKKVR